MQRGGWQLLSGNEVPKATSGQGKEILVSEPKILEVVRNRIYFYSEIDRPGILMLTKNLRERMNDILFTQQMDELSDPGRIFLHINSFGGSLFMGLAGMDSILTTSRGVPVETIIDGSCASAATFLSVVGTKRLINRHAFMLIHQLSSFMWGKYREFKDEMENLEKLMKTIKQVYAEFTSVPPEKLDEILDHDLWFNADECLKYNMVDEII